MPRSFFMDDWVLIDDETFVDDGMMSLMAPFCAVLFPTRCLGLN